MRIIDITINQRHNFLILYSPITLLFVPIILKKIPQPKLVAGKIIIHAYLPASFLTLAATGLILSILKASRLQFMSQYGIFCRMII